MLRIYDINMNKDIYETFLDCEIKKIVQVNGQIYIIRAKRDKPVAIMTSDLRIQTI